MKKLLFAILLLAVAAGVFVALRGPRLPDMRDPTGMLPTIPGDKRSVGQLEAALSDSDPAIRREALRSLGRMMDHGLVATTEVVPLLLTGTRDVDGQVRAVAAAYLANGQVETATSIPVLVTLLKDPDPLVRMNAANGLQLRSQAPEIETAVPALLEAWYDTDMDTRRHATSALLRFPEHRYSVPDEWSGLSPDEAKELARTYGWRADAESLRMAIRWNDIAGVALLLKSGVDPNSRDKAGMTPLFLVGGATRPEVVRLLLDAGADVTVKAAHGRYPWFFVFSSYSSNPDWRPFGDEVIDMLRAAYEEAGLDVDTL